MKRRNRAFVILVATIAVAGIGWLDLITGPDIGLSLIYLLPVAAVGWYAGLVAAVALGILAAGAWLTANLLWMPDGNLTVSLWNGFTRLVIYVSEGVMLALLRRDRDILRRYALREAALARTDIVTGLPNGRSFLESVQKEVDRARSTNRSLCVLYVDLDNFKKFNDYLGHAAGDDILVEVGNVLKDAIGEKDLVARIGGDEFALLLPGCNVSSATVAGEEIVDRVRGLASLYADVRFGATVGIAHFSSVPDSAEDLVRAADDAMYSGKSSGKGKVVLHEVP
ncbi:MAG TPA: diguanylate cyclase [Thermoanaerobaculia bacterium]